MRCLMCGSGELVHRARDLTYRYKGDTVVIPAVTGDYCSACGWISAKLPRFLVEA